MMKFFRKHNKKLLAVFMVLLMIVFLGGSALDSMLRVSGNQDVATSRLGVITYFDHAWVEETAQILASLGLDWQRPLGIQEPLESTDWILLVREAETLGLESDIERVQSGLLDSEGVSEIARRLRKKPERILLALAEYNAIQDTALAIGSAITPSEATVLSGARSSLDKVKINIVLLPATALLDEEAECTEEQIQTQFEVYRDREPGAGLAFGYYVQPAVQVQYIKVDHEALSKSIRVVNLEKKAKEYYKERRDRREFLRPPDESDTDASEVEGPVQEKSSHLTWVEGRDIAEEGVRKLEATDLASRIADWLVRYLNEPWLSQERTEESYKIQPEDVARLEYYEQVLTRFPKSLTFPDAVSTGTTDFFARAEADDVPEIGKALFVSQRAGSYETFANLAFRTQTIVPEIPSGKGTNPSDYLATFQTSRYPLRDANRNVFLFRVVDCRPGHIPDSVEEVRQRVVDDVRLLQAYDEAVARAESLRSCGADLSLRDAYESDEDLVALKEIEGGFDSGYYEVPAVALTSSYQAQIGQYGPNTAVGVTALRTLPTDVLQECFGLEDAEPKTKVFELKDRAIVVVAEWAETQRGQASDFDSMREGFADGMIRWRERAAIGDWLKPDTIRARNQFALITNP